MASFKDLQQQFVQSLTGRGGAGPSQGGMSPALASLIDALPYYGDPDFDAAHRGALTILLMNMPNDVIVVPEYDTYTGDYIGYADFFFTGNGFPERWSGADYNVANTIESQNANINEAWWGNYAVAVLTDAI